MQTNLQMLRNGLLPLIQHLEPRHISLLRGTKTYGTHVHPRMIPGKERSPTDNHENFYWLREDWLTKQQQPQHWQFTIWPCRGLVATPGHWMGWMLGSWQKVRIGSPRVHGRWIDL